MKTIKLLGIAVMATTLMTSCGGSSKSDSVTVKAKQSKLKGDLKNYFEGNYSGVNLAISLRELKTLAPFLIAVSITDRMMAKSRALL